MVARGLKYIKNVEYYRYRISDRLTALQGRAVASHAWRGRGWRRHQAEKAGSATWLGRIGLREADFAQRPAGGRRWEMQHCRAVEGAGGWAAKVSSSSERM